MKLCYLVFKIIYQHFSLPFHCHIPYIGRVAEKRFGCKLRFHLYMFKLVIYNESLFNKKLDLDKLKMQYVFKMHLLAICLIRLIKNETFKVFN